MGKTKDRPRYQSVSLPVPFVNEIKEHIKDKPEYTSIADFVKESIRRSIREEVNRSGNVFGGAKKEHDAINQELQKNIDKRLEDIFGKDIVDELKKRRS